MINYLLQKIFYSILVLFGVITLIFLIFTIIPGDPARMMLGQRTDSTSIAIIKQDLGLDKPVLMQYLKYINDLSPLAIYNPNEATSYIYLDSLKYTHYYKLSPLSKNKVLVLKYPYLRRSYQSKQNVSEIIADTLPNTFILAFVSIIFASIIGIFLGILAAVYKNSIYDRLSLFFVAIGMSLPSFFAAIIIGWLFAFVLADYTGLNLTGNLYEIDDLGEGQRLVLKNLILPAFTLGIRPLAIVLQLTRNSLLDVLNQDYIRTAKAKGLHFSRILFRHALPNSLNPVITAISGWFASLMAGVVFIEFIFGWKGLGYVIVNALNNYDLPVVMGCVITIAIIFIFVNILVDIIYGILDPRVQK